VQNQFGYGTAVVTIKNTFERIGVRKTGMIKIRSFALITLPLALLGGYARMTEVHDAAKAHAQANIAVIGQQPSPELASACERDFIANHVPEQYRNRWQRKTTFNTSQPWMTAQIMTYSGKPELGKKLVAYWTEFSGVGNLGLPQTERAVCFFRVDNGKASFETSCRRGSACPYPYHVPLNAQDVVLKLLL